MDGFEFDSNRSWSLIDESMKMRTFSAPVTVVLLLLMGTLVMLIVLGNALVIFSFKADKSLRRQSNYYFLNLAISDFLVGAFCIPVYMPYVLTGRWPLGRALCKLWLVTDYLLCSASAFSIVLISYDRFLSVTRAVTYRARQGAPRQAVTKMAAVWVLAFLLYGPAIVFWEVAAGASRVPAEECFAEFYYTWYFLLCASALEFFSPFVSVAFFNASIYLSIRRRRLVHAAHRRRHRHQPQERDPPPGGERRVPLRPASLFARRSEAVAPIPSAADRGSTSFDSQTAPPSPDAPRPQPDASSAAIAKGSAPHRCRLARDKKIAKSLAVIVCVFAVCWAPYTLMMIVRAACGGRCVQQHWYEVTFWLLWLNSAINPFLYPLCHGRFRRAFGRILCPGGRWSSSQPAANTPPSP